MPLITDQAKQILRHPGDFVAQALREFNANQGLLLAGAVAYYALLSIVPLLIVVVIGLSHIVDQADLIDTLGNYLEWLVPSQSKPLLKELSYFIENRLVIGGLLTVTMLFFSSLAFSVLSKAMSIIFAHRHIVSKRHFLASALLPYCYVGALGISLLIVTVMATGLEAMGQESIVFLGYRLPLQGISGLLLYLLGLGFEVAVFTSIYWVMPAGRTKTGHAIIGGCVTAALWEITRHVLVWYFSTLSQASVVYGSLTTAVVVLLSLEIAATLLLLGAQVISVYERIKPAS